MLKLFRCSQQFQTNIFSTLSWIDITLHVISSLAGAQSARIAADFAVVDTVPKSQSIYVPQDYLMATDPFLAEAEQIVRHALNRRLITQDLAASMAVSERTLHRRLKELTGEAPKVLSTAYGLRVPVRYFKLALNP